MSQIEQNFRYFLGKHPEIEKCYQKGLINRRSLARHLIREGVAGKEQLEAVIAMLRRYPFSQSEPDPEDVFKSVKVRIRDGISILDFEKNKRLLNELQKVISHTDYDKGDTLKIVMGSSSIKVFIDTENERVLQRIFDNFRLKRRMESISEISLTFPEKAPLVKGILSTVTRELLLNDVIITELLTASPELLIYVKEDYVMKAYEIIKRLGGCLRESPESTHG